MTRSVLITQCLQNDFVKPLDAHEPIPNHGDLNGANILVDGRENVWVIDFFHTARGHALKDLAKLENDILYIYTPITDEGPSWQQALAITTALRRVEDLAAPLPEHCEGIDAPQFQRAWSVLRTLRGIAGRLCREDRNPTQPQIALLRYAAHTLSFAESSPLQNQARFVEAYAAAQPRV